MRLIQQDYRDWTILISQLGSRWTYTCCPANGDPLNGSHSYAHPELACAEAKCFVDRTVARCKLRDLLDDWLEVGQINSREYDAADRLVAEIVKVAIADHLPSGQIRPVQSPENPPDSTPEHPA